jgi:acetyl-CoA C-acetyltransferase
MKSENIPVIISAGQITWKSDEIKSAQDLLEEAANLAIKGANSKSKVSKIQQFIDRVVVVNILGKKVEAPAATLARKLGIENVECCYTTVGGNTPQYLVNNYSKEIVEGKLSAVLITGAEAFASAKNYKKLKSQDKPHKVLDNLDKVDEGYVDKQDILIGDERIGVSDIEANAGLISPVHVYPLFESALAVKYGRNILEQRKYVSDLFAPFSKVASENKYSWFEKEYSSSELSTINGDNRPIADPYLKLHCAFLGSDQGAAIILTSLAVAKELNIEDSVVYVHSGANTTDIWNFSARPIFDESEGIELAATAALNAGKLSIDDINYIDLYSCFPSAVQLAINALGLSTKDPRGFTVTGGLPYFGGPGNNYVTHSIAAMTDKILNNGGYGLISGLGWYVTKHSYGIYSDKPPKDGFVLGDTSTEQLKIDSKELKVIPATEVTPQTGVIVAASPAYGPDSSVYTVPAIIDLEDGTRTVLTCGESDINAYKEVELVGKKVALRSDPAKWYEI